MSDAHHVIRLRGAWSVTPDGTRFRLRRPFGWPAVLAARERVWLVVAGAHRTDTVEVNGTPIEPEADITLLLRPRNEIVLTCGTESPPGEVTLEVRRGDSAPG